MTPGLTTRRQKNRFAKLGSEITVEVRLAAK